MAQWTVYRNRKPETASEVPFLVDVQSDLLSQLGTRVVIPLYRRGGASLQQISRLTPEFEIEGEVVPPDVAAARGHRAPRAR